MHRRILPNISRKVFSSTSWLRPSRFLKNSSAAFSVENGNNGHGKKRVPQDLSRRGESDLKTLIFNSIKSEDSKVKIPDVFAAIERSGLPLDDPRLTPFMSSLEEIKKAKDAQSIKTLVLEKDETFRAMEKCLVVISQALGKQFIIPEFEEFTKTINDIYEDTKSVKDGEPATYIPQLAKVDPDLWGVSLCTIDGQRHNIGDTNFEFTIQSCSKPLTYGLALEHLGRDRVHEFVGKEPSGRMFNSLTLDYNNKPHNPMINAGAMTVCSLLQALVKPELDMACKFEYVEEYLKKLAGNEFIGFSNSVFMSEKSCANRNNAIAYHMMENNVFPPNLQVKDILEFYFQCCSFEATCESLSVIAATLANAGVNPLTGEQVLAPESVRDVLTLMHSCGMYDYSGQFAFHVGLPAKSGVSGTTMVAIPGVMGLATLSPRLDPLGNSYKGLHFCRNLIRNFNFHRFDDTIHARPGSKDPRRPRHESMGQKVVTLLFAAAGGDVADIRRHYLSGLDINLSDYDGRTALHLAAAEGHEDVVKFLVHSCHANVDAKDRYGNTPLDDAECFGHTTIAEILKDAK